jgi:hypothetical protein
MISKDCHKYFMHATSIKAHKNKIDPTVFNKNLLWQSNYTIKTARKPKLYLNVLHLNCSIFSLISCSMSLSKWQNCAEKVLTSTFHCRNTSSLVWLDFILLTWCMRLVEIFFHMKRKGKAFLICWHRSWRLRG